MRKISIAKYLKNPPYDLEDVFLTSCTPDDVRHLFDTSGKDEGMPDVDMVLVYEIKNKEQVDYFKQLGVKIDFSDGHYYVESYEEE